MKTSIQVLTFWLAAAAVEIAARGNIVVTIVAIFASAYLYTRFCARRAGVSHALGVGIAWLVLAIVAEVAVTEHLGHGWYSLIGSPDQPLLRNIVLFVWIFAPAVFAQRGVEDCDA